MQTEKDVKNSAESSLDSYHFALAQVCLSEPIIGVQRQLTAIQNLRE